MALFLEKSDRIYKPIGEIGAKKLYQKICESMKGWEIDSLACKVVAAIAVYGLDIEKISSVVGEPLASIEKYYNNLREGSYFDTELDALILTSGLDINFKSAALTASGLVERKYVTEE